MTIITHPSSCDIDEVFAFMIQCDIAEYGSADSSREDLETEWKDPDLQKDLWIGRSSSGRIVGYAVTARDGSRFVQDVYIHPVETPEGVEDTLLDRCSQRFHELAAEDVSAKKPGITGYVTAVNRRLQLAYEKAGFSRHTFHYQMKIDLNDKFQAPEWPIQYQLQTFQTGNEMELYRFIQTAFDWQGHVTQPYDSWKSLLFRNGRYDPGLFILVRCQGELVGAALAYDEECRGWIRQLAVSKEYRGKGLGSLLLNHMFFVFASRKKESVGLGVASINENAFQFYERNGMYRCREYIEYRKQVD